MSMIDYQVRNNVAEILLNNPPVNAVDIVFMDELIGALHRARDDRNVRAVIIASALPGRFCAGLDLKALLDASPNDVHALVDRLYTKLVDAQFDLGKPSIAAVSGATRGGGMTVAISCDMIIAADTATFGYPEIDVGLIPAIHYTHLHRIVGRYRAFDLLFTGKTIDAQEAVALGLISRLAKADKVLDEARALAQILCAKPAKTMQMGRTAFLKAIDMDYRKGVAGAVESVCAVMTTDEAKEGITAFVEKRRPIWPV